MPTWNQKSKTNRSWMWRCANISAWYWKLALTIVLAAAAHGQTMVFNPGMASSVAGNGSTSYSPASYAGPAASAGLNFPRRIARDASGNLYWMEKGGQIARVMAAGNGPIPALPSVPSPQAGYVYTIAGNGGTTACAAKTDSFGDGCPAIQAYMTAPYGIAVDAHGNVYLDDTGDYLIRVVYAGGTVPNLPASPVVGDVYAMAGTGATGSAGDGGPALSAAIGSSHGVTVDAHGNIYLADSGNQSIRVIYAAGTIPGIASPVLGSMYTLAGGAAGVCSKPTSTCGDGGPAISAQIDGPDSVGVDGSGNIYFADTSDLRLRAIFVAGALPGIANPVAGDIYTVAGNGVSGSGPDGVQATASSVTSGMGQPFIDAAGDVYLPDDGSNTVRKINPAGIISTVFGGAAAVCAASTDTVGDGCPTNLATLNSVTGIVLDNLSNAYIADYKNNLIRLLTPGATTLYFGGAIGTTLANQTVAVSNGGTQALQLTNLAISGPFSQVTSGGSNCTSTTQLAPGATCQIVVSATVSQAGSNTGSIVIASNAQNGVSGQNTIDLTSTITLGSTTTALSASPLLANLGQAVTLTATVSAPAGVTLAPTGSVTFLNGTTPIGSTTLAGGKATYSISSLAAGTYNVTASYGGDTNFASSTSATGSFTVSATPVPVGTLQASSYSVPVGQPVTLTATFTQFSGTIVPTGTVTFAEGGVVLGLGTLGPSGTATLQVNSLPAGQNVLVANYGGDATFQAISSPSIVVTATTAALLTVFPGQIETVAGSHTLGAGYSGDGSAATAAQIKTPLGMSMDTAGDLYFADSANNRIRRIDAVTQVITTVAGTGTACAAATLPCGDNGQATAALLNGPQGVRVDAAGNLYILDKGDDAVRKVNARTGVIATVAGTLGSAGNSGNGGAATAAKLNGPRGMYLDNEDDMYIADSGNAVVRFVNGATGVISTIAGSGSSLGDGGPATSAELVNPRGVTLDSNGNLYIADIGSYRVRQVDGVTGVISTVAGNGTSCTAAPCGDGSLATSAELNGPEDVVTTPAGDLIITDPGLNAVRRVSPGGVISTIVGQQSATAGYLADGNSATAGLLSYPNSLLLDGEGDLYVSEANNSLIREVLSGTTSLSFGSLELGTGAGQMVTLASTGNQPVTISNISVAAGFAQQPSGSTDCAASLQLNSGASCQVDVQFTPLTAGTTAGAVNLADNAINTSSGLTVLSLTGVGTANSGTTAQTISFGSLPNVTYGAAPILLNATASSGLPVLYSSVTGPAVLSGSTLSITGAGAVSVTAYQFGNSTYAAATQVTQSFTVSPAQLTVTANNATRAAGAANPAFTYTIAGFVNGDTQAVVSGAPSLTSTATTTSAVGTYPISVSAGTLRAANYAFAFVNGTLTVSGQPQTITFGALANEVYGAGPIPLNASSNSALAVMYSVTGPATLSGTSLAVTGVGTVVVTATQAGNQTYAAATPVVQSFQVTPAQLTVTAANATRVVGTSNPTFTVTFSGFVNGDTASVVTGAAAFSTSATQPSPVGTYPITVSQGTLQAANYSFTFVGGTLTIVPVPPDFTLTSNLTSLTLNRGTTGHLTITLTPISNYNGSVTLSCGTPPAGVTCVFTPTTLVADGSGNPVTGTLDIQTNGSLAGLQQTGPARAAQIRDAGLLWIPAACLGLFLLRNRKTTAKLWKISLPLVLLLMLIGTVTGCGGPPAYVAPVVTTMTITGTGVAGSGNATHSLTLNISII